MGKKEILFVMGNGPSLKEIMDNPKYLNIIRQNHSFGLNAAYRAYDKYDFYPTYFGCFDYVVNESHKENFEKLVLSQNPIQKFYFIGNAQQKQNLFKEEVRNNEKFINFNFKTVPFGNKKIDVWPKDYSLKNLTHLGSSGVDACQLGLLMGYKQIYLVGCDCNYIDKFSDNIGIKGNLYSITDDVNHNPNYWFDDYQIKGDKYNKPNGDTTQINSWKRLHNYYYKNTNIINLSLNSKIPYFPKMHISSLSLKIGIYGIFIKDYIVFLASYLDSVTKYFLPGTAKKFLIATDDIDFVNKFKNKYNIEIVKVDYIGWPYESLYRFTYFNLFDSNLHQDCSHLYFLNSNIQFNKIIGKEIYPDESGYIFGKHNAFHNKNYDDCSFEKNNISTAFVPKNSFYAYCGGGLYGATRNNFIKMNTLLRNNIYKDENNNYIAIWHDESHINYSLMFY